MGFEDRLDVRVVAVHRFLAVLARDVMRNLPDGTRAVKRDSWREVPMPEGVQHAGIPMPWDSNWNTPTVRPLLKKVVFPDRQAECDRYRIKIMRRDGILNNGQVAGPGSPFSKGRSLYAMLVVHHDGSNIIQEARKKRREVPKRASARWRRRRHATPVCRVRSSSSNEAPRLRNSCGCEWSVISSVGFNPAR